MSDAVPMRELEFDQWVADLPHDFAGDLVMSHVLAVLSSVFPDGEDYFVRSVRAGAPAVTDPGLAADVEGFVGQESMHGREHRVLNERLAELGYPTRAIGRYVRGLTRVREKVQGRRGNLGFTAALEHYTATLAELLLGDPEARAVIGHPGVRDLLVWHALEEAEHKAVAFDVFRANGGSEWLRMLTMVITHLTFVLETGTWTLVSLARDPEARAHPGEVARGLWRLRRSPFTSGRALRMLAQYTTPGFHPDHRDTTALVAEWRERLFGDRGALVEALAS
ncbi:MAG TPA: metal-dependent hydrolase [Acidimicrobiales bacterium]|nr:metal-dependent hydrolase [Acidimicrobiales bacterium]